MNQSNLVSFSGYVHQLTLVWHFVLDYRELYPLAFKQTSPLLFTFGDISVAGEEERTTGICCFRLYEVVNTPRGKYLPQPLAAHCWLFTVWEASVQILFVKLKSGKENVADLRVQLRRPFKTYLSASKTVIYLIHHAWNATVWPWATRLHLCFDNSGNRMNPDVRYCLIVTSNGPHGRKNQNEYYVFFVQTDSSHNNKPQKWSKEEWKSDLFNVILKQKCQDSWDTEDNRNDMNIKTTLMDMQWFWHAETEQNKNKSANRHK